MSRRHPYVELPPERFWRRSVAGVDRHAFDPVIAPRFRIGADSAVATAGSCFAQHISRKLQSLGFNYLQCEGGESLDPQARKAGQYGLFSARYGNVYTARQLLQLFQRAFGLFDPREPAWQRPDGRWADPFRPSIEADGFGSIDAMLVERARHLAAVREVFERADLFVFTLGLTEGWRSREDGAMFPLAPGVIAGEHDPACHEFVNLGVQETQQDLAAFLAQLRAVNPGVKVLLTVSPVPLAATYEPRHVLVASTYSKSVLRVAAEDAWRRFDFVDYFPSYEIITGSYNAGAYFEDDHREVNALGVAHAMRCFVAHYLEGREPGAASVFVPPSVGDGSSLVCDEEALDQVRR